jgi:hypothetical protein
MSYHPGELIADLDQALGEGVGSREQGVTSHESRVTHRSRKWGVGRWELGVIAMGRRTLYS